MESYYQHFQEQESEIQKAVQPHLLEEEKVVHILQKSQKISVFNENTIDTIPFSLFFFLFIALTTVTNLVAGATLTLLAIVARVYWKSYERKLLENSQNFRPKGFVVLTNQRVITYNKEFSFAPFEKFHQFKIQGIGADRKQQLVFGTNFDYRYPTPKQEFIIDGDYEAEKIYKELLPHWKDRNPKNTMVKLVNELKTNYQLSVRAGRNKNKILEGDYNGMRLYCEVDTIFPATHFFIKISCPNPTESFFNFNDENGRTLVKKVTGVKEYRSNDKAFDAAFFLETDNSELLKQLLHSNLKEAMFNCTVVGACVWSFGDKGSKLPNQKFEKSSYQDQENILDFQMIEQENTVSEQIIWKENINSSLQLRVEVPSKFQTSARALQQLVLNGMLSATLLADGIVDYHKKTLNQ